MRRAVIRKAARLCATRTRDILISGRLDIFGLSLANLEGGSYVFQSPTADSHLFRAWQPTQAGAHDCITCFLHSFGCEQVQLFSVPVQFGRGAVLPLYTAERCGGHSSCKAYCSGKGPQMQCQLVTKIITHGRGLHYRHLSPCLAPSDPPARRWRRHALSRP